MKTKLASFLFLIICTPFLLGAQSPSAYSDRIFLCFEENSLNIPVQGSTGVPGYETCVEAKSVSYGVENATTIGSASGGAGAGKAKLSNFTFTKAVDLTSPALFITAARGGHFENVQVVFARVPVSKGGVITETLRVQLKLAFVTKIDTAASSDASVAETIELVYGALAFQVAGSGTCFDTVTNSEGGLCSE